MVTPNLVPVNCWNFPSSTSAAQPLNQTRAQAQAQAQARARAPPTSACVRSSAPVSSVRNVFACLLFKLSVLVMRCTSASGDCSAGRGLIS
eukprot:COSAG05_NODE_15620_length_365_cov_0.774436_1_plen_90_part_10